MESHIVYRDVHYELSFRKLWENFEWFQSKKRTILAGSCRRMDRWML